MKRLFAILAAVALLGGCSHNAETTAPQRHYQLSGEVVAVNAQDRTAIIKAAPIPGWMEAMTMEYPIRSKSDLNRLRPGEHIRATVEVRADGEYDLSDIRESGPQQAGPKPGAVK